MKKLGLVAGAAFCEKTEFAPSTKQSCKAIILTTFIFTFFIIILSHSEGTALRRPIKQRVVSNVTTRSKFPKAPLSSPSQAPRGVAMPFDSLDPHLVAHRQEKICQWLRLDLEVASARQPATGRTGDENRQVGVSMFIAISIA